MTACYFDHARDQLELLMIRWRRIEALLAEPGPCIHLATRSHFRPLNLES